MRWCRPIAAVLVLAALAAARSGLADVTASNVASLARKWDFPAPGGVTGGAIVVNGRVYFGSWGGKIFALDATTGAQVWSTDVGIVTGRVLVTDDGGVCYGTLNGSAGCLNASDGSTRWKKDLTEPSPGAVWSAPVAANGRLFVGVASVSDQPCTRGRLVTLDLASGNELWRFYTVPDKVCDTDTSVVCTTNVDCPDAGNCVKGIGGGVTASVATDPTGEWVYMNTVGCYTSPSIGESDSVFKIAASTGTVAWRHRVNAPEQYGTCDNDTSIDCGVAAHCTSVGGGCTKKALYHDFGFLNGPLRIETPAGGGGTLTRIVSGSKNGTLYAFEEATGDIAWTNVVRATPVSPGFAGYGLFNGAITYAEGRIYAALGFMVPARVCSNDAKKGCSTDGDCPGGTCPLEPKHLMSFDPASGATVWAEEIGRSWSHVAVANGIVYAGTGATLGNNPKDAFLYAHDAATGARLATFELPASSTARPALVGDTLYVGYGFGDGSGLVAFSLCGNGTLDPGEQCDPGASNAAGCCSAACTLEPAGHACGEDDGNVCTASACDAAGQCVTTMTDDACDDGDPCTGGDVCVNGACAGVMTTVDQLTCSLDRLVQAPCGDGGMPKSLANAIQRAIGGLERTLPKATKFAAAGKTSKVERIRRAALKRLDGLGNKVGKAAQSHKASRRISADCRQALEALLASRKQVLGTFVF